jgi:hypothetical protein
VIGRFRINPLPLWVPEGYRLHQRIVDMEGYWTGSKEEASEYRSLDELARQGPRWTLVAALEGRWRAISSAMSTSATRRHPPQRRPGGERLCTLVIIGARLDGT